MVATVPEVCRHRKASSCLIQNEKQKEKQKEDATKVTLKQHSGIQH